MSDLRRKTLDGIIWTFAQQFGVQFINFFVSILLARILLPAEFGLLGMIAIFVSLGNTLIDSGMGSSLIRTENPDQLDYSTVFYTNLLFSCGAYLVAFLTAPLIADFFNQPILTNLVRVYCLSLILAAFSTVQSVKLNKEMRFKTQMMINIPSLIISAALGIFLAYRGFGVWSLIYMNMCQLFVATVQLWIFSKWTPALVFDRQRFKEHFAFGYKVALSGIMNSLVKNVYNIVIGRFFSPATLGFYTRAKSMQELPVTNISNALNKVTYPMFASIKDDDLKLKAVYERLIEVITFVVAPVLLLAIVVAEPLFRFLLTEKWLPAVPFFQILCIAGVLMPISAYNLNILLVKGRSDIYLKLGIIKNVLTIVSVAMAVPFGIYGLMWSIVAMQVLTFFINAFYCGKLLQLSILRQLALMLPSFVLAFISAVAAFFVGLMLRNSLKGDFLPIIFVSLAFGITYLGLCVILRIRAISHVKSLLLRSKN